MTTEWTQDPILHWVREGVIGRDATIRTPHGTLPKRYFDYTASGLPFGPIEDLIRDRVLPWMANTHTEASATGGYMTELYQKAHESAAREVGAVEGEDVVIFTGSGATGAINKLIRNIGLVIPEPIDRMMKVRAQIPETERPLVVISRMEHHSNDLPWRESIADVVMIGTNDEGVIDPDELERVLKEYEERPLKIGSFCAVSNVTGIINDCDALARVMHRYGGYACFDYAAAAPYVDVDMHPDDPEARKDAVFISVHKYLGGPQTPGLLVANKRLFRSRVPVDPGGGTVIYTSPWDHAYIEDLQHREEGGTPNIVGVIRAGLVFDLKAQIGTERMQRVEEHFVGRAIARWRENEHIHILGDESAERIGIVSLIIDEGRCHHNLAVRLLSDRFGVQTRGGCMCAGTYGHDLLGIGAARSFEIRCALDDGDVASKPGWTRISFSPATTEEDFQLLLESVEEVAANWQEWGRDYEMSGEVWLHKSRDASTENRTLELIPPGV
jgi:selenocysteine lyase/cysteine desulfurase